MNKLKNRYLYTWFLGTLTLLLIAGCDNTPQLANGTLVPAEKVVQVEVESLAVTDLREQFTLPGSLEAWEDLVIAAEQAGPIRQLAVVEGSRVAAGSPLLKLGCESLESALRRDRENAEVTQGRLLRYQELAGEGLVSQQELDDLRNSATAAVSGMTATRTVLEKCQPRAPISGVVDRLYVDRGEYIDVGKPLLRLVNVEQLQVIADVPEKDVPFLHIGQAVEIIAAAMNHLQLAPLNGTIEHIALTADPATRTYRTKIRIDNKAGQLRPGMIVRARFDRQQLAGVLSAPMYAVLERSGEKLVFLADNGRARRQTVDVGSAVGSRVVLKSGVEPGQQLIVKGQQLLMDGVAIQVRGE